MTDANGKTTSWTYDATHGGVLTHTMPAVGGVQPVVRYSYAQHYAWIKSGSGYVQAAGPVWLPAATRTCRTSATAGNACAAGSADEVVTSYEYQAGNASTPSNLLLKGMVVTSGGPSLRTCYRYDANGRKISATYQVGVFVQAYDGARASDIDALQIEYGNGASAYGP